MVFILDDDLGWADLPVYGNKFNEAPNLTQMADQGIRFTSAYAACPVCSPTRASIMSGQYPARVGITDFITGHWRPYEEVIVPKNRVQYLPLEIHTMGDALQSAGYRTGYFGKWHLGDTPELLPMNQGFDLAFYIKQSNNQCRQLWRGEQLVADPFDNRRLTESFTAEAIEFVEANQANPFFLYLPLSAPHFPAQAHLFVYHAQTLPRGNNMTFPIRAGATCATRLADRKSVV